jgi:hypothetical protein
MLEATRFFSHPKGLFLGWEKIPTLLSSPPHLTSSNRTLERGKPTPVTLSINFDFDSLALYPHKK